MSSHDGEGDDIWGDGDPKLPSSISDRREESTFSYDTPNRHLFRLFQLTIPEPGDSSKDLPLSGRIMSFTFDHGDGEYIETFTAAVREDRHAVLRSLSGSKKYIGVSYFWGSATDSSPLYLQQIKIRDQSEPSAESNLEVVGSGYIYIRSSLREFLLEMRRQREQLFMWIDAICIDQNSSKDKEYQIPRMKELYEYSEMVYVWLGKGGASESMALKMMPNVTARLSARHTNSDESLETRFRGAGLPEPSHDIWKAYAGIWTRDWWSRLWTFQEVTMAPEAKGAVKYEKYYKAPNVFIWCGETKTMWEQFDLFSEALVDAGLLSWLITGQQDVMWDHLHGLDAIAEVRTGRESLLQYGWGCSLSALLVATRRRDASEAADMVWGMYALIDRPTRKTLALDPVMPADEIFLNFAKHYIRNEVKECLLNHTATLKRLPGLPSWCPDFASREETTSIGSRWFGHYQERPWLKKQMPCAGFQKKGTWALPRSRAYHAKYVTNALQGRHSLAGLYSTKNPRQIALVPATNAIIASGIYLDTITEVVPCNAAADSVSFLSFNSIQQTSAWDQACFSLAQTTLRNDPSLSTSKSRYDLYARTLVANRVAPVYREKLKPDSTWSEVLRESWKSDSDDDDGKEQQIVIDREQVVDFGGPYLSLRSFMRATLDVGETLSARDNLDHTARKFANCLQLMSRKRRFFATKAGRIGLGPSDARPGDQVVVIFYCPTPYLIRPLADTRSTNDAAQWQFVGEAYVNGFMYGEALARFDEGKLHETKWTIH